MKASIYLLSLLSLSACFGSSSEISPPPTAVRVVEVHQGPIVEGTRYFAEIVPAKTIKVLAQVPGTVSELGAAEGELVKRGGSLVRISAPDIAARISRVRAERGRAQRERDFACEQVQTDRNLAATGDLPNIQLDRSEKGCAAASLAVDAARAAEREAGVAGTKSLEKAPFDGSIVVQMIDEGQTVMPGMPLLQFASEELVIKLRVPEADAATLSVGTKVITDSGWGLVSEIGAQTMGPGRLVEVLVTSKQAITRRPGATLAATIVTEERADATSVPEDAISKDSDGTYILVRDGDKVSRTAVEVGPSEDGWVAITPDLAPGTEVVSGSVSTIDTTKPVMAVSL